MIFAGFGRLAPGMLPGELGSGYAPVDIERASSPIPQRYQTAAIPVAPATIAPVAPISPTAPIPLPNGPLVPTAAPVPPAALWPVGDTVKDIKWIVIGSVAFVGLIGIILILK